MHQVDMMAIADTSLPVRGAWIEIPIVLQMLPKLGSRSPCGERGLKYDNFLKLAGDVESLPVRGAWIEIKSTQRR